jgi:hypothetical protein
MDPELELSTEAARHLGLPDTDPISGEPVIWAAPVPLAPAPSAEPAIPTASAPARPKRSARAILGDAA